MSEIIALSKEFVSGNYSDEENSILQPLLAVLDIMDNAIDLFIKIGQDFIDASIVPNKNNLKSDWNQADDLIRKGNKLIGLTKLIDINMIKPTKTVLQKRIERIKVLNQSLELVYQSLQDVARLKLLFAFLTNDFIFVNQTWELCHQYQVELNSSRVELAKEVTGNSTRKAFSNIINAFTKLKKSMPDIEDSLNGLITLSDLIWDSVRNEELTKNLYNAYMEDYNSVLRLENTHNISCVSDLIYWIGNSDAEMVEGCSFVGNESAPLYEFIQNMLHILPLNDEFSGKIRKQEEYLKAILEQFAIVSYSGDKFKVITDQLLKKMTSFLDGNKITEDLYRHNFMRVDVFMEELRYQEISQQKAYDVIMLLSDIGGSFGLFIGASILSVVHIIDILLHNMIQYWCL